MGVSVASSLFLDRGAGAGGGGEGNGGVILKESHYGRDSLVGATLFLSRMARENQTVSQIFNSMPQFIMVKDKVTLGNIIPDMAINSLEETFPKIYYIHASRRRAVFREAVF